MTAILILAALPEEADAVFPGQGSASDSGGWAVRAVATERAELRIAVTGLGKVHAALAVGALAAVQRPDLIVMTGTCGALSPARGAHWIADAVQHDFGAALPKGFRRYRAGDWPIGPAGDVHFTPVADPGLGLPHARIASGDAFIACPDTAAEVARGVAATLVDMEVAAVAQAAARLGIGWAAIKAVTDGADGSSAGDFSANLRAAARQAGAACERLIALL